MMTEFDSEVQVSNFQDCTNKKADYLTIETNKQVMQAHMPGLYVLVKSRKTKENVLGRAIQVSIGRLQTPVVRHFHTGYGIHIAVISMGKIVSTFTTIN